MNENISKTYAPKEFEEKIYHKWEEEKCFHAQVNSEKEPFTIVIPPPNVTGQLHMGHALNLTLQDVLVRFKRMMGFETLWLPGSDHAGIATQVRVEEHLRKEEGITKYDLGREAFLERVWDWKNQYGNRIVDQTKRMGSSCDWDRTRFTMDEGCSKAVREVFVNLYEKGLIYQGSRIINWCPDCTTALSDAEVEYEEKDGNFWYIKYMVKDSDAFLTIATTRPETLLGDTAVAVNPKDERYTHLIGKTLILPILNREIPIIADEYVDKEFGTGAVKITPAHDPNDFEVGMRHNLPQIKVLNDDGTINKLGGKYNGMDRYVARKQLIKDLDEAGLLVKIEPHKHNVGQCYRCSTVVEPITSKQWFVKMNPLAGEAIRVVKDDTIKFVPERFTKVYLNWMENVHDWCISRQLWWGHRIPAFYCEDCGETIVSKENVTKCPHCSGTVKQDDDVLDTWFSSALWPFSTLGYPDDTKELAYFYPTSVLVTAYDIIFFWVARMIFSGMEHMKKEPFKHVFIHGIVRDDLGRKMSKSLGNGIDPLEVIDQYGADALRFTLATGNSPGNDIRFSWKRVESSRNFANKIWNATRFLLMNLTVDEIKLPQILELEDKWILSKYNTLAKEATENIEKHELGIAVQKLYDFIWDEFCDWYIELVKPRLMEKNSENAQYVLLYVLSNTMKLLHPFMPFITEEIWHHLPTGDTQIMMQQYPVFQDDLQFDAEEKELEMIKDTIKAIRNMRTEMDVPPSRKAKTILVTDHTELFQKGALFFEKLASASEVIVTKNEVEGEYATAVVDGAKIFVSLGDLIDFEKELARLTKEKEGLLDEIKRVESKLANESFVSRAPQAVVDQEREKGEKYKEMLAKVEQNLAKIK